MKCRRLLKIYNKYTSAVWWKLRLLNCHFSFQFVLVRYHCRSAHFCFCRFIVGFLHFPYKHTKTNIFAIGFSLFANGALSNSHRSTCQRLIACNNNKWNSTFANILRCLLSYLSLCVFCCCWCWYEMIQWHFIDRINCISYASWIVAKHGYANQPQK